MSNTFSFDEFNQELDASFKAQEYCRSLWGAARGHGDWRKFHDAFIAGYKASKQPLLKIDAGWYWVRFNRADDTLSEPLPAQWDGQHWQSVGWSGMPLYRTHVLERIVVPNTSTITKE